MYKSNISYRFRNCYIVVSRILIICYDIGPSNYSTHLSDRSLRKGTSHPLQGHEHLHVYKS